MNVYTCTEFPGHWPVGVAAVIVAEDEAFARASLLVELRTNGFPSATLDDIGEMNLLDTTVRSVNILDDGDY